MVAGTRGNYISTWLSTKTSVDCLSLFTPCFAKTKKFQQSMDNSATVNHDHLLQYIVNFNLID